MKIPDPKAAVDKEWDKLEKIPAWQRSPKWHCKRRFWLLRSIYWTRIICIANDSAKVMDIISRLLGCAGQAADAVSALGQNGRGTDVTENSKVRMSRCFWYVHQNTYGPNHGPVWKIQSFLSKGICTVTLQQDYYGKGNLRKFYWNTVGKRFQTGNVYSSTEQNYCSYQCMWTISNWLGKSRTLVQHGLMKDVDLGEPTSFLDHVYLGCTQRECQTGRDILTTCFDFLSEAMLSIKEVEMVNSLDELKSSRSVDGKNFPNFEMLDARIASALNKII